MLTFIFLFKYYLDKLNLKLSFSKEYVLNLIHFCRNLITYLKLLRPVE